MEAKIELNDEQIEQAIQVAILAEIDSQGRDKIIQAAIVYLMTPTPSKIDGKTEESPLMRAFYRAADRVMEKVITEEIEKTGSEFRQAIQNVVMEGVVKWLSKQGEERAEITDKIASAIHKAITPDGRYY
jgi:hypothetical protein